MSTALSNDAPGATAAPGAPSVLLLLLSALVVLAISAFGLSLIWDRIPQVRLLQQLQPDAQDRSQQQTRAEIAAEMWDAELRDGLRCAGEIATRRQLAADPATSALAAGNTAAGASPSLCTRMPASLRLVLVLDGRQPDMRSATRLHGDAPAAAAQVLGDRQRAQIAAALHSQWDTYALAPGAVPGIDQFVPVRHVSPASVLLLRYGWPEGQVAPRLIDEASADQGVPVARTRGLRLAIDETEASRRWLITVSWLLLSLLVVGLVWGRFRSRLHRAALRRQVDSARLLQQAAERAAKAADDARVKADEAHADAVRAQHEALQSKDDLAREVRLRTDIENSSPVGLRVIDDQGRLLEVNQAFCTTSGWSRAQLLGGRPPYPYWPAAEVDHRRSQLQEVLADRVDPDGFRVEFVRPDGERWLAHVRASRLQSGQGWILSSMDMTAEQARQQQVEKLAQEVMRQADFFILGEQALQLAHDLSSHVLAIEQSAVNLSGVIDLQSDRPESKDLLNIERQSTLMKRQLDDFAFQVKGELRYERFSIHEMVEGAILLESDRAKALNARITNIVSEDLAPQMLARIPLMQVVRNLISNGLKAMADARPENRRIVIGSDVDTDPPSETHPQGRHWLHLTVDDRGRGLDPGLVARLFDEPKAGSGGGLGLGLWLCQRWVQRMGGQISVLRTNNPRGTVMLIVLPYVPEPGHD